MTDKRDAALNVLPPMSGPHLPYATEIVGCPACKERVVVQRTDDGVSRLIHLGDACEPYGVWAHGPRAEDPYFVAVAERYEESMKKRGTS